MSCPFVTLEPPTLAQMQQATGTYAPMRSAIAEIDATLRSYGDSGVGIAAVVAFGGGTVLKTGYGPARFDSAQNPIAPQFNSTVWKIGSVTKVFTSLMMMHLVQQGVIPSVDSSAHAHLPGFCPLDHDCESDPLTFASLASQLSGLVREPGGPCDSDASRCDITFDEILPWLNSQRLLWPPNLRPAYSNLGFAVLGQALATAVGETYESYLSGLLAQLGMADSGFVVTADVLARLARGDRAGTPLTDLGWSKPDGGMQSTAADMERFVHFLVGAAPAPSVLDTAGLKRWAQLRTVMPDALSGYGMPWEMIRMDDRFVNTKSGSIDEFGSFVAFDPLAKVGLWLNVNQPGIADAIGENITRAAVGGAVAALQAYSAASAALPARHAQMVGSYEGYVASVYGNMTLDVYASETSLDLLFHMPTGSLIPATLAPLPASEWQVTLQLPQLPGLGCLLVTELALSGEALVFAAPTGDSSGPSPHLHIPGMFAPTTFVRVAPSPPSPPSPPAADPPTPPPSASPPPAAVPIAWPEWASVTVGMIVSLLVLVVVLFLVLVLCWLRTRRAPQAPSALIKEVGMQAMANGNAKMLSTGAPRSGDALE